MTVNFKDLPDCVQYAITARRRGRKPEPVTAAEAFSEFCEWEGLIGWSSTLRTVWEACKAAEVRIVDETELTDVVVVGQRAYTVPRDIAREFSKLLNRNAALLSLCSALESRPRDAARPPTINPRRWFGPTGDPSTFSEPDRDFVLNNLDACVHFLEGR